MSKASLQTNVDKERGAYSSGLQYNSGMTGTKLMQTIIE